MAWGWKISKFTLSLGLSLISNNPIGWSVGGVSSGAAYFYGNIQLNNSDLSLNSKETALMTKEFAIDYGSSLALGGIGEGISVVYKGLASSSAQVAKEAGQQAAKEIAKNSGQFTPLARELINLGKTAAKDKAQYLAKAGGGLSWIKRIDFIKETFTSFGKEIIDGIKEAENDDEFLLRIEYALQENKTILETIAEKEGQELVESFDIVYKMRELMLVLNKENVNAYLKSQENRSKHEEINKQINWILKKLKKYQLTLHDRNQCSSANWSCRFCFLGKVKGVFK